MLDARMRTLGKSKTFAILQVFALLLATLSIYAVQSSTPANAYQALTAA